MDVLARWAEVVGRPEDRVPLDEAALLISAGANRDLDVEGQLERLDELARRVEEPGTDAVCRYLFIDIGLRGDRAGYDDPANSFLDRVLDRRLGIPISLSVLLIEVARRRGVRLEAVGMPGHFLVRDPAHPDRLIDAFHGGRRLDHAGCERLLRSATGRSARLTPEMLESTGTHSILARMLANLDRSFERRDDRRSLAWVSEMRAHLPAALVGDRLQLANRLAGLGRFDIAASVLEQVAGAGLPETARDKVAAEALSLRARLN